MKRIGWLFLAILFLGCTRQGMSQEAQANPNQNLETQAPIRTVAPSDAPVPSDPPAPTETPVPAFYDRFVAGEPILTEDSYQSENVAVFLSCVEDTSGRFAKHLVYRVADIYLKDAASVSKISTILTAHLHHPSNGEK